jgi:hypothetical protein
MLYVKTRQIREEDEKKVMFKTQISNLISDLTGRQHTTPHINIAHIIANGRRMTAARQCRQKTTLQ